MFNTIKTTHGSEDEEEESNEEICYTGKEYDNIEKKDHSSTFVKQKLREVCKRIKDSTFHSVLPNIANDEVIGTGAYGTVYKFSSKASKLFKIDEYKNDQFIAVKKLTNPDYFEVFNEMNTSNCFENYKLLGGNPMFKLSTADYCFEKENKGSADKEYYLIMKYYPYTLNKYIDIIKKRPDYFKTITKIMIILCIELKAIHEHDFLHRDIKPQNIFIDGNGHPHLGDFGIATPNRSSVNDRMGTANYMSPSVAKKDYYDREADFFSLGLVFNNLVNKDFQSHHKMLNFANFSNIFENENYQQYNPNTNILQWPANFSYLRELVKNNISHDLILTKIIEKLKIQLTNQMPVLELNKKIARNNSESQFKTLSSMYSQKKKFVKFTNNGNKSTQHLPKIQSSRFKIMI